MWSGWSVLVFFMYDFYTKNYLTIVSILTSSVKVLAFSHAFVK